MFVGHYAASLAAKAASPKTPLWTLAAAAQLIDFGWAALIMADVEHAGIDTTLQGSPLVLYDMPWTHSLPAVIVWSLATMVLAKALLRQSWGSSALIGAVVFSHWLLDLFVHRPDLELYPNGPKVGFAFWDYAVAEQAVEIGLIAIAGAAWVASRKEIGRTAWPAIAFIAFLVALQIVAMFSQPKDGAALAMGGSALAVYVLATLIAGLVDRSSSKKA